MTDNFYKPSFKWIVNSGYGMVDNLDTFRKYGTDIFRSDILDDWIRDIQDELDLASYEVEKLGNIDHIDKENLKHDITGNIRYYKPTFCWDLDDVEGSIGNLSKFRKLHPLFRKSVLKDWMHDLEYASRVTLFDFNSKKKS